MKQAEPYDRQRYGRLVRHLLHLLTTGDASGFLSVGDDDPMPWEVDDQAVISDTITRAKLQVNVGNLMAGGMQ